MEEEPLLPLTVGAVGTVGTVGTVLAEGSRAAPFTGFLLGFIFRCSLYVML